MRDCKKKRNKIESGSISFVSFALTKHDISLERESKNGYKSRVTSPLRDAKSHESKREFDVDTNIDAG